MLHGQNTVQEQRQNDWTPIEKKTLNKKEDGD
jgi:hypothetical protein